MKKLYCWILVLLLLLSGCGQTNVGGTPSVKTEDPTAVPEAEELLKTLCSAEYQGRAVGSAGNELAAEYIATQFKPFGLEPLADDYLQPYEEQCVRTENVAAHAALIASDGSRTELTAGTDFIFYPVYEDVDVTLPVSEDAAACADGAAIYYSDDLQAAYNFVQDTADVFAVACGDLDQNYSQNNNVNASRGAFFILAEVHRALLCAPGTVLELSISPCVEVDTASNVVAVLRGSEGKNAFVVGAHFDGCGICGERLYPAAYDNASGTVAMLEIARLLVGAQLKNDVIFVAFNGEESGHDGAKAFANQALNGYERVNLFNFDCVGHQDSEVHTIFDDYGLNAPLKRAVLEILGDKGAGGDEYPGDGREFNGMKNVSCVSVADADFDGLVALSPIHTSLDVSARIDCARIRELANAIAEVIRADVLYEQDAALLTEEPDELTGLMPAETEKYNSLIGDGILNAYGQAYVYNTGEGGSYVLTGSMKYLLSAEELEAACPGLGIPGNVGDYQFVYAELQGILDGSQYYDLRVKLPETLEVGTLIDLTERITPHRVEVYYLASDGRGIKVFIGPVTEGAFDETEDGGILDAALKDTRLMHLVNADYGIDGYWRMALPQDDGRVIYIGFFDGATLVSRVTGWETDHSTPNSRFLKPDELLTEFAALDLTALEKVCKQIVDFTY